MNRCVSCGYCEPVCPSKDITLTPRQRIVMLRAMEQAWIDGDTALLAQLEKDYDYEAVLTCAVDGMCQTAGINLLVPQDIDDLCCGTPWSSKGLAKGLESMRARTLAALREATRDGELAIICDASSCTEGLLAVVESDSSDPNHRRLRIVDAMQFVAERVLPSLGPYAKLDSLALHPTCSSTRLGLNGSLSAVANAVSDTVQIPESWGCCAFADDRGMLHPELTESATQNRQPK